MKIEKIHIYNEENSKSGGPEATLIRVCEFLDDLKDKDGRYPKKEISYCRAYYKGQWWRTWFSVQDLSDRSLGEEIDSFVDAFFERREFYDLDSLSEFCRNHAAATTDPTEYNLFSDTEHFNIWIRLITRSNDYNVYLTFLEK